MKPWILRVIPAITSFLFILSVSEPLALNIEYTASGATPVQLAAFERAARRWEFWLTDPITVNIELAMSSGLPSNVLGQTASSSYYAQFADFKVLFNADRTSAADDDAMLYLNNLGTYNSYLLFNSNDVYPNGSDNVSYLDTWDMWGTSANLKALGFTGMDTVDAGMQFNSNFAFDYNPSDGITDGQYDFVGIATHEIGHVLGVVSVTDINANFNRITNPPSIFDFYRHTDTYGSNEIDISFDGRNAWFSYDFGLTRIDLSDGKNSPDERQASHWADGQGLGILDPTAASGELLRISKNDLLAMDVIGWDLNPVPEPASILLLGLGLPAMALKRKTGYFSPKQSCPQRHHEA